MINWIYSKGILTVIYAVVAQESVFSSTVLLAYSGE